MKSHKIHTSPNYQLALVRSLIPDKIHTSPSYQLACGYILTHRAPFGAHFKTHMEHGTYFVRLYPDNDKMYEAQWCSRNYGELPRLRRLAREGYRARVLALYTTAEDNALSATERNRLIADRLAEDQS